MLQTVLAATALAGLLFISGGLCQCFTNTDCTGDEVAVADRRACCVETDNGLSYNDGTTCTLCIVHGFLQTEYSVEEGNAVDTVFQLNVKGTTQFNNITINGIITAEPATNTTSDSDFESLQPIAVSNSAEIRFSAVDDDITLESDRVDLIFTPEVPDLTDGLEGVGEYIRDTAVVNIIDNDLLEINFEETDYYIVEGSTVSDSLINLQFSTAQRSFTVALSAVTVTNVEMEGLGFFISADSIANYSRATAGEDFSGQTITVTIPADSGTFEIPQFFTVEDDDIDENYAQSFAIVAEIGLDVPDDIACFQTSFRPQCEGRRGATEIRILDNDPVVIGFTKRNQTVREDLSTPTSENDILVDLATLRISERNVPMLFRVLEAASTAIVKPLTAIPDTRYDARFGSTDSPIEEFFVLEPLQDTIPPLRVSIRNDNVPEGNESFTIRILLVDCIGDCAYFTCNEDQDGASDYFCEHTVFIVDDDEPFAVAFVETTYTVDESAGYVEVCVNLTQPMIDILDETVRVFITDDPSSVYIPPDAPPATPDEPNFLGQYEMLEGTDYAQRTNAINVIDDIPIREEMRTICYNQTIYEDFSLELNEYAGLSLGINIFATTARTEIEPMFDQASILIVDNDFAVVGLEQMLFTVIEENVDVVELCVNVSSPVIDCPIDFPFEVRLSTLGQTAIPTVDFEPIDMVIMFEACEMRKCVNVDIIDDMMEEQQELFAFHLERTPELDPRIQLEPANGGVLIISQDLAIEVGYEFTVYTATEGEGFVTLCAVIMNFPDGAPRPITINATTVDGTAVAGRDYVAVIDLPLMFGLGERTVCHNIDIIQDRLCELNRVEVFFLNLRVDSTGPIELSPAVASVIINDSAEFECAVVIGFTKRNQTVREDLSTPTSENDILIDLATLRISERDVPMLFRVLEATSTAIVKPLTAIPDTRYDARFGSTDSPIEEFFVLEPLQDTIPPLRVSIRNDNVPEGNESFTIRILLVDCIGDCASFTCNEDQDGASDYFCEHTVFIVDDDEPFAVAFVETMHTVDESAGYVEVCVNLTQPMIDILDETVRVFITDDPSSVYIPPDAPLATPDEPNFLGQYEMLEGTDYAQRTNAINVIDDIPIREEMRTICYNQTIYEDFSLELNEYAGLSLGINIFATTARTEIEPMFDQASILIVDNDFAVVGLEQMLFTVIEENVDVVELCVNVSSPVIDCPIDFPFEVRLSTLGQTAIPTVDFEPIDMVIMFEACEMRKCVDVDIIDDMMEEQQELFTFHLERTPELDPRIQLEPANGGVIIISQDLPIEVGYEFTVYTTTEEEGFVTLCAVIMNFPDGAPRPITINATTEDGTAVAGRDYVAVIDLPLMFGLGERTVCHNIDIIQDRLCELNRVEVFFLNLRVNSIGPIELSPAVASVIIDDSAEFECEPIVVGYDPAEYVISEDGETVDLLIRVLSHPGGAPRLFILIVNTEDGTARADDGDYAAVSGQVILFNSGDRLKNHTIFIRDDIECEQTPNELFFSTITLSRGVRPIDVVTSHAIVFISDSDGRECADIRVGYKSTVHTTSEGNAVVELCAILYEPFIDGPSPRPFTLSYETSDGTAIPGEDYVSSLGELVFRSGDSSQCHEVQILQDDVCEQVEYFFSHLTLVSGRQVILVDPSDTRVIIEDPTSCPGGFFVNDTVTGDPLMTVPIYTDRSGVDISSDTESLCYEVHGEADAYFNLISDECTSVSAYYEAVVTPNVGINLNVMTRIGVRATGSSRCWNIRVDLDNCTTTVRGTGLSGTTTVGGGTSFDGIAVRTYPLSSRVRISVPNCADTMLVMWVFCKTGRVRDPDTTGVYYDIRFIRFVVMRGLNLNEQSHGLIGQFWNVPVTITPHSGLFGGQQRTDDYIITVDHPQSDPRTFVGLKVDLTWESERRVCYYVGNNQGGGVSDVDDPGLNDPVIEGDYRQYKVESLFSTEFAYSHFDEGSC